jgi:hypothetical protein
LLADDPFDGGWIVHGADLRLTEAPGLDLRLKP